MLDFANESYVRLYVRNTLTWKKLGWEGRCVFPQALRVADRAGIIGIGPDDPAEALAELIDGPIEFVRVAVERMLALDVMRHVGNELVFPRYIEANETGRADIVRQRELRLKRRDKVVARKQQLDLPTQVQLSCNNENINVSTGRDTCHDQLSKVELSKVELRSDTEDHSEGDTREQPDAPPLCQVVNLKKASKAVRKAAAELGHRWLNEWHAKRGKRASCLAANRELYVEIGRKPDQERVLVAQHLSETEWILEDPRRAKPRHIVNHWDEYVEGPRNFRPKAVSPPQDSIGPSPYRRLDLPPVALGGE